MKKYLLIGFALTALLSPLQSLAERSVTLLTSEFPPYHSQSLPHQGILAQIVEEAFAVSGYQVTFHFKPFARTLLEGKQGSSDGVLSLWYSDERSRFFLFSDPLPANRIGFFARKEIRLHDRRFSRGSPYNLAPYLIGVVRGYDNPQGLLTGLDTEISTTDAQNISMLVAGRLDLALIDHDTGVYLLRKNHPDQAADFTWLEPAIEERAQYVGFSKQAIGHQAKHQDFNRGLAELEASGRIEAIIKLHGYDP